MDEQQVVRAIKQIELGVEALKQAFRAERPAKTRQADSSLKFAIAESVPKAELGPAPDWNSPEWPEAVSARLIVTESASEQEKKFRAIQVVGALDFDISGRYCLDLGCGGGYITAEMAEKTTVIGYDVIQRPSWQNFPGVQFTCRKEEIKSGFDFILCYDVFDHIVNEHPVNLFAWAASLLSPSGTMFVRAHPWTSRHGSHSYETVNKAYLHLILSEEEMQAAKVPVDCSLRLVRPMASYESVFRKAGLTVTDRQMIVTEVDDFFTDALLQRINKVTWKGNITPDVARKIMRTQFVDYTLRRS